MSDHSHDNCFHCGLPVPDDTFQAEIKGEKRDFCCLGCQSVCKAIYDAGMEGFYQRTPEGTLLTPPTELPRDLALYDMDEVQAEFVPDLAQKRDIHLLVEGIHCAACVWLIEKTLARMPGVIEAKVNLSAKRLLLSWDNEAVKLSAILQELARIGYAATPFDPEVAEGQLKKNNLALLYRLAFAGFAMMNLLWISIALYSGADEGEFRTLFHWVGFALATPTLFYSGWPFFRGAWTGIKSMHLGMDLPIAIGATVTYVYSVYVTLTGSQTGEVYFDTVVNFIFVILVGRHLEAMSKRHAVAATQRLMELQPKVAYRWKDNKAKPVPVRSLKMDDVVLVKPGDTVPVDGVVVAGQSTINEAMLSGESRAVNKGIDDSVSAGTINLDSSLEVRVTGTLMETALGRIIRLVEQAQASKAPIQCTADMIVPWFVMVTLILASLTFIYWVSHNFEVALMAATSVLIITCPCAFGLATPMAIAVASGQGAKHGILVKNGTVLETLSEIEHFVFDKTGTLTKGERRVQKIQTTGSSEEELLRSIAALEAYSEHNVAKAITLAADERELIYSNLAVEQVKNTPGQGIQGEVDGIVWRVGNLSWLKANNIRLDDAILAQADRWEKQANSCIYCARGEVLAGIVAIADELREEALPLINKLRDKGVKLTLLSGDQSQVAHAIAEQLGGMNVIAEVLPEDKDKVIAKLQQSGEQVAMVGDGINDAPALIRSDVGIAVGSGTDVSVESADIVLMSDELDKIFLAMQLSRRTLKTIYQNIGISITYNVIMVPLAMMAFITPLIAAISMPISSLLVIGNAARIRTLFKGR